MRLPLAGFIRFCCWTGTELAGAAWFICSRALRGSCQVVVCSMWLQGNKTVENKTENSCFKFIRKNTKTKVESSNRKAWASHAEQSMTQSWFNKHLENTEFDFQAFSKRWLFQEAKLHQVSLDLHFFPKKIRKHFILSPGITLVKMLFYILCRYRVLRRKPNHK